MRGLEKRKREKRTKREREKRERKKKKKKKKKKRGQVPKLHHNPTISLPKCYSNSCFQSRSRPLQTGAPPHCQKCVTRARPSAASHVPTTITCATNRFQGATRSGAGSSRNCQSAQEGPAEGARGSRTLSGVAAPECLRHTASKGPQNGGLSSSLSQRCLHNARAKRCHQHGNMPKGGRDEEGQEGGGGKKGGGEREREREREREI